MKSSQIMRRGKVASAPAGITRVNGSAIVHGTWGATPHSTTFGVQVLAGDLIVAACLSNGTHATNGMSIKDAVNNTNFSTISETVNGDDSTNWLQTFCFVTPVDIPSGTNITFSPYVASDKNVFCVDVFRGARTISRAVTSASGGWGTTASNPALGSAPSAGDLVLTLVTLPYGTATKPTAFSAGSTGDSSHGTVGIGYVLSASGSSTYSGTWTWSAGVGSALQTLAFAHL